MLNLAVLRQPNPNFQKNPVKIGRFNQKNNCFTTKNWLTIQTYSEYHNSIWKHKVVLQLYVKTCGKPATIRLSKKNTIISKLIQISCS